VIDPQCVERRPLGATAWSKVQGREYDDLTADKDGPESTDSKMSERKTLLSEPAGHASDKAGVLVERPGPSEQPGQNNQENEKLCDADFIARWRRSDADGGRNVTRLSRPGKSRLYKLPHATASALAAAGSR
jgi:hypothetical protein